MGDLTTPLIVVTPHESGEPSDDGKRGESMSLDEAMERCLGKFGRGQFLQSLLVSAAWLFDAQQTFITVFTDAQPTRDCSSTISEWGLSTILVGGLPSSSFFLGCLVGGVVIGTLADSVGRKNMLVLSSLSMSLFTSSPSSPPTSGSTPPSDSSPASPAAPSAPAPSSSPPSSSANAGEPSESPRWLWIKNRQDEAINAIKRISSDDVVLDFNHVQVILMPQTSSSSEDQSLMMKTLLLVQNKWALKRLTTVMILGFGIGLVYYGMPLGVGDLGFNLYLSVTLNALSELPASLITFFLIGRLNRRTSLLGFAAASGITSLICCVGFVGPQTKIVMELVSFFTACTAFNVLLIYTLELFPTSVRNSALSMVRQALVMGGVVSPLMVMTGRKYGSFIWTYGLFGFFILCSGVFAVFLPETRGAAFCDTMDEQEQHIKNQQSLLS
ncbi:hypothetical protein Sjap_000066 [Stephania japonica]|uniref:Uncharacterized protein n=1 Tax=Stephania japonica TaxID=461633 RepID=A0AAP0KHC3_9MAGN